MTGVDDLVTWLRAQLDDDERVAQAAIAEHDGEASWPIEAVPRVGVRLLWLAVMDSCSPETMPPSMAEHISRGDPAHRLAEVDAKRRMLDWCDRMEIVDSHGGLMARDARTFRRLLALPYADRAGYREQWRP